LFGSGKGIVSDFELGSLLDRLLFGLGLALVLEFGWELRFGLLLMWVLGFGLVKVLLMVAG
jgi:hypothetical protein